MNFLIETASTPSAYVYAGRRISISNRMTQEAANRARKKGELPLKEKLSLSLFVNPSTNRI